jgi:hypothetical protein
MIRVLLLLLEYILSSSTDESLVSSVFAIGSPVGCVGIFDESDSEGSVDGSEASMDGSVGRIVGVTCLLDNETGGKDEDLSKEEVIELLEAGLVPSSKAPSPLKPSRLTSFLPLNLPDWPVTASKIDSKTSLIVVNKKDLMLFILYINGVEPNKPRHF